MQSIRGPDENIGGAIAQLGERLLCTQEVGGSIPPGSTNHLWHCDFVEDRGSFESSRTRSQLLTTKNYMNRVVQTRRDSTLFNNLEKVFDVLSGSTFKWIHFEVSHLHMSHDTVCLRADRCADEL